jgi:hypothetical protein
MSVERFIKSSEPIRVELNGKEYLVKPLSFKNYISIQRQLRKSFAEDLNTEQKEDAYLESVTKLCEALNLPTDEVLDCDNEFVTRLVDVFLLGMKQ